VQTVQQQNTWLVYAGNVTRTHLQALCATAVSWLTGNLFCEMEALHIGAMIGAMNSQTFLSNHVGI